MIYHILSADNMFTTDQYVRDWEPQLKNSFHLIPLQELAEAERLPVGTFIFSDIERQTLEQRELLAQVWETLEAHGPPMRLLNHPLRARRRFDLLEMLAKERRNSYRVFRCNEIPSDLRFPVFIRVATDHQGPRTKRIFSWAGLESSIVALAMRGFPVEHLAVIEFCDTSNSEGIFRKYSAYRVGDRIVPRGLNFSEKWYAKGRDMSPVWRSEPKWEYVRTNPDARALLEIFQLAEIEFGRIDYGINNGKVEVWEINTCPQFSVGTPEWYFEDRRNYHQFCADSLAGAFEAIGTPISDARVPIRMNWPTLPRVSEPA